jgi:RHH-type transcriptional regulator, rel operon repressor / antitoxin RelB
MVNPVKDGQISLRLPLDMKQRMESYAELTGRNKSHVVMEAVGEYLAWRLPQIEDLRSAIEAADAGHFASDAEVEAVFSRYAKPGPTRTVARKAPPKAKTIPRRGR